MRDERQKKEGEERMKKPSGPSGLLPHLLFCLSPRDHTGMFSSRHQSQDVMGFDSPFLTLSAVVLTLTRNGDGSHADCSAARLSDSIVVRETKMQIDPTEMMFFLQMRE